MKKRLPTWVKIVYGIPQAGGFLIDNTLFAWIIYFYTTGGRDGHELIPPVIVGTILLLGRLVDAMADPLVARLSDNCSSRWGRRVPFLAFSGIFKVIFFIALFHPPVQHGLTWNVVYLASMLSLYFIVFSIYGPPYLALIPELAGSTSERVNLSTFKASFGLVGIGAALIGSGILIDRIGFQQMSWVLGLAALPLLYTVPLFIRERKYTSAAPATLGLKDAVKITLQNRPFILYLAGCVSFWFGYNFVVQSIPFYVTVLLGRSEGDAAIFYGAVGVVTVISFIFINRYARVWGLKNMMMAALLLFAVILPLTFILGVSFLGIEPLAIALLLMSILGIPVAILTVVPEAIVASISDFDEKITGQRREAMYYGIQGLVMKVAIGLSAAVIGVIFQVFGQTPEQPLGVQLTGPVAGFFMLLGLIVFSRYPEKEVTACEKGAGTGSFISS